MLSLPVLQRAQVPQNSGPQTATASPTSRPVAPVPSASTHPAVSWPSVNGSSALKTPASNSWITWRSEWQMPAAPTRTSTWPGPGSGWGTSWYSGAVFHATMRYACMSASVT